MNDSNVTPDEWEAQLIDYTLGVMDPAEAAAFEQGLEECRKHVRSARDYEAVAGWMGAAVPPAEPPEGHKNRLMSRLQATPQAQAAASAIPQDGTVAATGRPTLLVVPPVAESEAPEKVTDLGEYKARRNYTGLLALVAGVAIFLLALWGWSSYTALQDITNTVHIPPGYTPLALQPQKGYEGVNAVAFYNPDKNDVVFVGGKLPQLPENQVYELWFLKKVGDPAPAGVFRPDAAGTAAHAATGAQTMADYAGFAVTVEPSPGVQAPTGNAVVAGQYSTP